MASQHSVLSQLTLPLGRWVLSSQEGASILYFSTDIRNEDLLKVELLCFHLTSGFGCRWCANWVGSWLLVDNDWWYLGRSAGEAGRKSPVSDPAKAAVICHLSSTAPFLPLLLHCPWPRWHIVDTSLITRNFIHFTNHFNVKEKLHFYFVKVLKGNFHLYAGSTLDKPHSS